MKIYIVWDEGYYSEGSLYGAYSTHAKASEALKYRHPEYGWHPNQIVSIEIDASPDYRTGDDLAAL